MKLTQTMRNAGIISIGTMNLNGSCTCQVRIEHIDIGCSDTNFRKLDDKHVADLLRDFDPLAMRNPMLMYVSRRRKIPTMDSRHTVKMLKLLNEQAREDGKPEPYKVIPCDVFFKITVVQAARIFYYLTQKSKRMDPWSAFYAARCGKLPFAVQITTLLDEFNFTTPIDDGVPPSAEADITSVEPLIEAWGHGEAEFVSDLLTLVEAFVDRQGYLDPLAGTSGFMRGLIDLRRECSDYEASTIASWFGGRNDAQRLKAVAHSISNREKKRLGRQHYRKAMFAVIPERSRRRAA